MAFQFYLDGQLTDQPMNDKELSTSIKRNSSLGALLVTQDVDLEWNGNNAPGPLEISGYFYLKNIFDAGICSEVNIKIIEVLDTNQTVTIYVGVIKVPSLRFKLHQAIVNCQIQDNSFYAYLNNNKSIKYNLQSTTTKNGEVIISPNIYEVDMFVGQTGVYLSTNTPAEYFYGYRVYDAFEFIIKAISDNKVGFYSNFLQQEPCPIVFDGFALRSSGSNPNITTSFNQLFNECKKIYNLSFFVDYTDPESPIVVMEPSDILYQSQSILQFTEIKDLDVGVNESRLYGTIKVGAENNPNGAAPEYTMQNADFFTYNDEVFTPSGQCNIDNELDLLSSIHISNNDINYQVNGGSTDFYDDLFLVECENVNTSLFTAQAIMYNPWTASNPAASNPMFYNYGFSNLSKINNNGNNFQSILTNTLTVGTTGFNAANSTEFNAGSTDPYFSGVLLGLPETPIIFNNVTSPGNYNSGDYNPLTGIYTAPADGLYSFAANYNFEVEGLKLCFSSPFTVTTGGTGLPVGSYDDMLLWDIVYVTAQIKHYDSLNNLISTSRQRVIINYLQNSSTININYSANMITGDYIVWTLESKIYKKLTASVASTYPVGFNSNIINPLHPDFGYTISPPSYYTWNWGQCPASPYVNIFCKIDSTTACTGTPTEGITLGITQPGTFEEYQYRFTYEIPQSDFLQIKANPTTLFIFEKDGIERIGWIESMKRDDWTGITDITLVTNNATSTQ